MRTEYKRAWRAKKILEDPEYYKKRYKKEKEARTPEQIERRRKSIADWAKRNPQKIRDKVNRKYANDPDFRSRRRENSRKCNRMAYTELKDSAVAHALLSGRDSSRKYVPWVLSPKELPQTLIEAKRAELKLRRLIRKTKEKKHGKCNAQTT